MLCNRSKTQILRVVQMLSSTLQLFMYAITVHKQNRNQKTFTITVLWKQLLPKQTETHRTRFIVLTWWSHYIFKDNTFIQHPDSRLALTQLVKEQEPHQAMTTLRGFVNCCTQKTGTRKSQQLLWLFFRFLNGSRCYWWRLLFYQTLVRFNEFKN